jgi:endoribonuclease LACTB2
VTPPSPPLPIALRTPTLPPASHTNCYLIGRRAAVVVDPGSGYHGELAKLRRAIWRHRGSGGGVQCVLLTHHHPDHVGGAAALARELGLPVAAHPESLSRLSWTREGDTLPLKDGSNLEVDPGDLLRILHTPGHAPGHLCVHHPSHRTLYVGDMLAGVGTVLIEPSEGDMAVYLDSLRRLHRLPGLRWILPGHGPAIPFESIAQVIDHRLWRESRVLESLRRGAVDLEVITRTAYEDVPPITWPLASRSALAHLIKLEQEGAVKRLGQGWGLTHGAGGETFDA